MGYVGEKLTVDLCQLQFVMCQWIPGGRAIYQSSMYQYYYNLGKFCIQYAETRLATSDLLWCEFMFQFLLCLQASVRRKNKVLFSSPQNKGKKEAGIWPKFALLHLRWERPFLSGLCWNLETETTKQKSVSQCWNFFTI